MDNFPINAILTSDRFIEWIHRSISPCSQETVRYLKIACPLAYLFFYCLIVIQLYKTYSKKCAVIFACHPFVLIGSTYSLETASTWISLSFLIACKEQNKAIKGILLFSYMATILCFMELTKFFSFSCVALLSLPGRREKMKFLSLIIGVVFLVYSFRPSLIFYYPKQSLNCSIWSLIELFINDKRLKSLYRIVQVSIIPSVYYPLHEILLKKYPKSSQNILICSLWAISIAWSEKTSGIDFLIATIVIHGEFKTTRSIWIYLLYATAFINGSLEEDSILHFILVL
jgi:hypothetical protein